MAHTSGWLGVLILLAATPVAFAADVVTGLNAEYFGDRHLSRSITRRVDPNIDCHWGHARPHPDVPADHFSIRWSGWIRAPQPGRYKLILTGDDGFRLYLDKKLQIDVWKIGYNHQSVFVDLTGQPQEIVVELFEYDRPAWVTLWWEPPGAKKPWVVPTDVLFVDEESAKARGRSRKPPQRGLVADYFDTQFKRRYSRSLVYRTEAVWGDWNTDPLAPANGGARYSGFLVPETNGRYKLNSFADDNLRVWIDEKPILEGNSTAYIDLEAGKPYPLTIEYVDTGHWGSWFLHWTPPETSHETSIPSELLYPTKQALPKETASRKG